MAVDKLVDSAQLDSDLEDVADAIRAKSGGESPLAFPAGFISEIGSIQTGGGGVNPFTLSVASGYSGQSPADAFTLIVNAVVAAIGDKPFFAWLTTGSHLNQITYLLYIPASITQQKDSGLGWFGLFNRAENPATAGHYFYGTIINGFDPVNTTASVTKMAASSRSVSVLTTDVFTVIDLSGVISIT